MSYEMAPGRAGCVVAVLTNAYGKSKGTGQLSEAPPVRTEATYAQGRDAQQHQQ